MESWWMGEAFGVDGWLGRIGAGRMILVHSRELIEGVRKQKKEGEHGVEGCWCGAPWRSCFCFSAEHWRNAAPQILSVNLQWAKTSQTAGGKEKVDFSGAEPTNGISHSSEPLGGKHRLHTKKTSLKKNYTAENERIVNVLINKERLIIKD